MNTFTSDSPTQASGRFSRRAYLAWNLLLGIIFMLIAVVVALLTPGAQNSLTEGAVSTPLMIIFFIMYAIAIYYSVIFLIRRLHDRDHSGWLALLILVPVLNILFALYVLFAPGNSGSTTPDQRLGNSAGSFVYCRICYWHTRCDHGSVLPRLCNPITTSYDSRIILICRVYLHKQQHIF